MDYIEISEFFSTELGGISAYIFSMKVKDLLPIYYVAVRGRDKIEGAVQRVLNKRRIGSIKSFILEGNMFFNSFILNWTDKNYPITSENGNLKVPKVSAAAQVIDGQHRLEGLKQAVEEKREIGEQSVTVVLVQNLSTSDAAKIFLNINTEQKPVPSSLVYDLFGEVRSKDYYVVRAKDIATKLHIDPNSPYYQCIRMPGAAQGVLFSRRLIHLDVVKVSKSPREFFIQKRRSKAWQRAKLPHYMSALAVTMKSKGRAFPSKTKRPCWRNMPARVALPVFGTLLTMGSPALALTDPASPP